MSTFTVQFKGKTNTIKFEVEIDDSLTDERFYFGTLKDETIYGNDQDLDTIIYPGSVAFEFMLVPKQKGGLPNPFGDPDPYADYGIPSTKDINDEYFKLISSLSFKDTVVKVYKNNVEYLRGYIQKNNIGTDYSRKAIKVNVISDFSKVKDLNPKFLSTTAYQSAPNEGKILYTDLVLKLVQEVYPLVEHVALISDVKSRTSTTFLGQPYDSTAQYLGDWNYYYVGVTSKYTKASDVIKDICFMFGCVAVVIDDTIYLISRFYFSQTTVTLSKNRYYKGDGPTLLSSQKMDALQLLVTRFPNANSQYEFIYGEATKTINYDNKSGSSFALGQTINWSGGSAVILDINQSGTSGSLKLKLSGENRGPYDNASLTSSGGGTADVNGWFYDLENSENIETVYISGVGGDPPGIDGTVYPLLVDNMWVYIPGYVAGIGNERWEVTVRNSFFTTNGSLLPIWKCVGDKIWDLIKEDRLVFSQKLPGLDWAYNTYYKYDVNAFIFRPRKIYYDELSETTKIELIKS